MPVFALVKPNFYAQALTFTRNPDFGATPILAQKYKAKPAGAKLYQHQQAVSYVTAEDDTKLEAKRRRHGWAFSLDSKQK